MKQTSPRYIYDEMKLILGKKRLEEEILSTLTDKELDRILRKIDTWLGLKVYEEQEAFYDRKGN